MCKRIFFCFLGRDGGTEVAFLALHWTKDFLELWPSALVLCGREISCKKVGWVSWPNKGKFYLRCGALSSRAPIP